MDLRIEAVTLGVTDVDRAKAFYEQIGFSCDLDHQTAEQFRVVQFTPPGSNCSIIFGTNVGGGAPGAVQNLYLCVDDIETTLADFATKSIDVSDPFHFGSNGQATGLHPERAKYSTFATFFDPDGNGWMLQEVDRRGE